MKKIIGYKEVNTFGRRNRPRIGYEPIYEDLGPRRLTTMDWNVEVPKPPMDANKYIWGKER